MHICCLVRQAADGSSGDRARSDSLSADGQCSCLTVPHWVAKARRTIWLVRVVADVNHPGGSGSTYLQRAQCSEPLGRMIASMVYDHIDNLQGP